mgnify:FL=1
MLFDPFEEKLNLPSALVQPSNGQSGKDEVVGQERQTDIVLIVVEHDAPKFLEVALRCVEPGEGDGLIAPQPGGSDDEERAMLVQLIEPLEIDIRTVHDIERPGFKNELLQDVDLMDI